jgi:hypothetical protein
MRHVDIDRDRLIAFALGKLSKEQSLEVLEEVEGNRDLSAELEEIVALMRATAEEVENPEAQRRGVREPAMGYLLKAAAMVVFLLGVTVIASELTRDRFHDLARIEEVDYSLNWRGESGGELEWARNVFLGGDRKGAVEQLERFVQMHPTGEEMSVAHWMAGAMLLASSERSWLGFFPGYDRQLVLRGMDHLASAAQSSNVRIAEESHWLRSKGYLMLGQLVEAKKEGMEVVKLGGSLAARSAKLMTILESE